MRILAPALLALLLAAPTAAQHPLAIDARVRVLAPPLEDWRVGRVQSVQGDTLGLRTGSSVQAISLAEAERLEVSRGRNRLLWSAGGALAGAVAGVVYTRATDDTDDPGDIGGLQDTADGVGNTILGMLGGAVVGFFVAPERWRAVALPLQR